jgi:DNA-binding LacI/PurR family transcriptional regulator
MTLKRTAPTLLDVAKRAGVHKNTVSVALNSRRATTVISDETRQRIMAAVSELGYQPNAVARSLRHRRTNSIGFYRYSELGPLYAHDPFNAAVVTGLTSGCHSQGQDLLIHVSFPRDRVEDVYLALTNGKVDGLVLLPLANDPLTERLAAAHLPVVAIADAVPGMPSVTVDDAGGSRLIAEYLAERGHRRILYRNEDSVFTSTQRRLRGFLDAAADLGLEVTLGNLVGRRPDIQPDEAALLRHDNPVRPTAIVCWNDYVARDTITYCQGAGLRVPEDIAVVGFDGIYTPSEMPPRLTTIRAPWTEVAETAVRLVVDLVEGREVQPETVLPVTLVIGDTT